MHSAEPSLKNTHYSLDHDTASLTSSFKQLAAGTELYGETNKYFNANVIKDEPEQTGVLNSNSQLPEGRPNMPPVASSSQAYSETSNLSASLHNMLPTYKDSMGNFYVMRPCGGMVALTPVMHAHSKNDGSQVENAQHPLHVVEPVPPLQSIARPTYAKAKAIVERHSSFQHFRPLTSRQSDGRKLRDSHAQLLDVLQFNGLVDHSASSRYGDLDTATSVLNSATSSARNSVKSSARASCRSDWSPMCNDSYREMKPALLPP